MATDWKNTMLNQEELQTMALFDLAAGAHASIRSVSLDASFFARLEGLGITPGRTVRLVKRGDPLIVQVYGSQVGLARSVAENIQVSPA